ncbi:hypothetical protein [Microbacterium sp. SS28]|uniref:hypothetical protein n=1 Tax=Microbacterium sp. SS28 TaxID=2919948 RepID=UPI001FA9A278|nr:hypothetical protein [Microbacterium sp. SS28]
MNVYIEYPGDWIGVPRFGAGEVFAVPADWAAALTDELIAESGARPGRVERQALVDALTIMGTGSQERGASSSYIHYPGWGATLELVDVVLLDRSVVGDAEAAEVAGAHEPDLLRPATVTEVETPAGLRGSLVVRHAPLDADAAEVVTLRASCALDVGDGFVLLGTATTDLAAFEAFSPHFRALVDSVRVAVE